MLGLPLYMLVHNVLHQGFDVFPSDEINQLQDTCTPCIVARQSSMEKTWSCGITSDCSTLQVLIAQQRRLYQMSIATS